MQELAKVIKNENGIAEIEVGGREECGGCKACVFGKKEKHLFKAENKIGAKAGDDVLIEFSLTAKKTIFASVVTMLIPLGFLFLGILLGYLLALPDIITFVLGIAGLFIGFSLVYVIDRFANKKGNFLAKILALASPEDLKPIVPPEDKTE